MQLKFNACPKCGAQTRIAQDELLSENIISKRESGKNGKIVRYSVGRRKVRTECEGCGNIQDYELKFKEKTG